MELLGFYIFGSGGKALVEICVIGFLMGTCVAFFVVIGDLCPILVSKAFNIQNSPSLRLWMIIFTTLVCIIPLSFQQSIKSLSFVCKASIAFYICLTLKTVVESFSTFNNDDNWTSKLELWNLGGVLQCIPIFSMAMSCQMQLFEVYENISSFDRIRQNIYHATSICLVVYTIIGFFGYVAFYNENLSGNILVNFRPSLANDVITFGFILSIACSFPLVIFPCRTSLNSLLQKSKIHHSEFSPYVPENRYKPLTLFIIFSTMILGVLVPSVEVIIGFVGSTIGILICVLFPATCFIKIMQRNTGEKCIAQLMIVIGFIVMILGTYSNLMALDTAKRNQIVPEAIQVPNIPPPAPIIIDQLPASIEKKMNESVGKISDDGIKKEEQEMAATNPPRINANGDVRKEIKKKDEEIKELKESKKKLEKEVLEIKQELVKQNKETQQLVLQKFDEIAEKVDKIQEKSLDKEEETKKKEESIKKEEPLKNEEDHVKAEEKVNDDPKDATNELINVVNLLLDENNKDVKEKVLEKPKGSQESPRPVEEKVEVIEEPKVIKKEETAEEVANVVADPIVQHIVQKSQEPLSYQVGEKMMEEKKKNATVEKQHSNKTQNLEISSHEDYKHEMRKKRETDEELELLLPSDALEMQIKTIMSIGRDLKAVKNEN